MSTGQFEDSFLKKKRVPLAFHGSLKVHQIPRKTKYSTEKESLSLLDAFPRKHLFRKREERTLLGTLIDFAKFTCVTTKPESELRNINLIPFRNVVEEKENLLGNWVTELPYILGPTNPWPIAVLMEPFSTSVFKVLIWILATTTKICTRGCFIQEQSLKFQCKPPSPPTLWSVNKKNASKVKYW